MKGMREVQTDVLIKLLLDLPDDTTVQPNTVGNLVVNGPDYEMLGYIDFQAEEFVPVD